LLRIATRGVRPDGARDEDLSAGDLARLAREADAGARDPLELVLEEMLGELRPAGAEGVRLDQLRPGADVAEMDAEDAFRRAQVRLLGAAQPRHRARDQGPHPAVGDDRRPRRQAL